MSPFVLECEQTLPTSKVGLGRLCGPNLQGLVSNHSLTPKYRRHAPCFVLVDRLPMLICHCKPLNTYFKPISSSTCGNPSVRSHTCLLYTSDAADEEDSVDLGGSRIIKQKK